jgi:hypothetical protein
MRWWVRGGDDTYAGDTDAAAAGAALQLNWEREKKQKQGARIERKN